MDAEPGLPVHPQAHARRHGGCWIVLPGILTTLGHLIFIALLLAKWEALEAANGGVLNFTAGFTSPAAELPLAGPSWFSVFAPSWVAELVVCAMGACTVASLPHTAHNLRLLHINSIAQSMLCALFQLLFAFRLTIERGSWFLVFSPWYMAMAAQTSLHYRKTTDGRGRRPGFPIGILHLLALVVSFKLEGAFNYDKSSWANVLWPLWGVAGFFLLSLALGVCCGLPCLLRRDAQVRCHLLCMFSALLLLLCSVVLPALLAAVRLTMWLDGDASIECRAILVPYLIAVSIVLLLLCVSLAIVSFSSAVRARGLAGGSSADGDDDDGNALAELFSSLPAPKALVRESSTLFRRVSSATMDKFEARHPELDHDSLLSRHRQRDGDSAGGGGADDRSSEGSNASAEHAIELGELPACLPRQCEEGAVRPPVGELGEICVDQPLAEPGTEGAEAGGGAGGTARDGDSDGDGAHGDGGAASSGSADGGVRRNGKLVDADDEEEDGLGGEFCWICCQGPREAVLLECGHGGICFSCAERCARTRPPLCPMCRTRITQIVRIAGPAEMVDGEVLVQTENAPPPSGTVAAQAAAEEASEASSLAPSSSAVESDSLPLIR